MRSTRHSLGVFSIGLAMVLGAGMAAPVMADHPTSTGAKGSGPNMLRLRYAEFDPAAGGPAVPAALRAPANNEMFMVQFGRTPVEQDRVNLRAAGMNIERYLPDNAYLVRIPAGAATRAQKIAGVRAVLPYEPAFRVSSEVMADILAGGEEPVRYSIECLQSGMAQQQAVSDFIRGMGGTVELVSPDQYRMEATLTPDQVRQVALRNEISYIDPWGGPGGTDMQVVRTTNGAIPTLSGAGFTGQGVRGEVHDTECLLTHVAFQTPPVLLHGVNGNAGAHGTACYGINFAHWNTNTFYNGMCTDAEQGIFFYYPQSTQFGGGTTRLTFNTQAVDPAGTFRSSYQTSSVGSAQTTLYTTISSETEDYLFKIDYTSFQSQSNTGNMTSRPQAWAKNIISVGGIFWQGTVSRADDSFTGAFTGPSFGPAADGRQKPDISNTAYETCPATWSSSTTGTTDFNGTSACTPVTAGGGGLVAQMWHSGVWAGHGGGSSVFADRPYSTTTKALMINTAYRYPVTQNGLTRYHIGWGAPGLDNMYNLRDKTFVVDNTTPLQQGQVATYHLNVAAGEPAFNVTMCYIDPMPATTASPNRVNDLSLRVTAPDGTTQYWGNVGVTGAAATNISTPGGSEDHINTVENVFIPTPAAGSWTVEVIATSVVQDAYPTGRAGVTPTGPTDAAFSLVASGATVGGAACYANCDGSTTAPILNVNDFLCFQAAFAAGASYANCDGSTTAPVLNVNDFLCFQTQFAAGCP